VPGGSAPFIDVWAPAQFVYGGSGGSGPVRSPDNPVVAAVASGGGAVNSGDSTFDPNLTYKIAGTIILSLVLIFVLQASGFRFVGAVGVGR
jgi:hypothetical protein